MKLKMLMLIFAAAAGMSAQIANPTSWVTMGSVNCRYWKDASRDARTAYVVGFTDAAVVSEPQSTLRHYLPGANYAEVVDGVTSICAVPENARILLWNALAIFVEKFNGADEAKLSAMTGAFRKFASAEPKQ
jgi:hypothetical protein